MKQLPLTDELKARLNAVAPDVDAGKVAIFQAAALSTAPVRKKHPVYNGAVHTTNFLAQMMAEVKKESRPLQIMHGSSDGDQLPVGRVFDGQLSEGTGIDGATELLTLFWIDREHESLINKVDSGTIDQVSVAILGKSAKSSATGFDFMGPDATVENIWLGVDDEGNRMGEGGVHVVVDDLDQWFEMSLVGQGGAQGARIKGNRLQLSASGREVPSLTLELSTGSAPPKPPTPPEPGQTQDTVDMDAKDFAAIIAEGAAKLANAETAKAAAEAKATELQGKLDAAAIELTGLKGSDLAKEVAELRAEKADLTTKLDAATALPGKLLAPLFAMLGQPLATLDADEAKAVAQVKGLGESLRSLGAKLTSGVGHFGATGPIRQGGNAAFRRRA